MPDPSFRFDPGQWRTFTRRSASRRLLGVGHPDAVRRAQPLGGEADGREIRDVVEPGLARGRRRFPRAARTRACGRAGRARSRRAAVASSRSREQEIANRGASAARSRPSAAPCQRACSARLSSSASRVGLIQPRRAPRRGRSSGTCRRWRAVRSARAPRTPRPCRAPSPSSAPTSCRRAAARRRRAARPRAASVVVRRLERPDARRAARRAAAGRRRVRERASGTDGRASGRSRAARVAPAASIVVVRASVVRRRAPTAAMRPSAIHTSPRDDVHRVVHRQDGGVTDEEPACPRVSGRCVPTAPRRAARTRRPRGRRGRRSSPVRLGARRERPR